MASTALVLGTAPSPRPYSTQAPSGVAIGPKASWVHGYQAGEPFHSA